MDIPLEQFRVHEAVVQDMVEMDLREEEEEDSTVIPSVDKDIPPRTQTAETTEDMVIELADEQTDDPVLQSDETLAQVRDSLPALQQTEVHRIPMTLRYSTRWARLPSLESP
mmetsp:Transcript_9296/g.9378  ORF Transcript_9296/g.9378 Transcript_9296/m.9378 type:complete len:112 (+) Transcript_9296:107-442(+)